MESSERTTFSVYFFIKRHKPLKNGEAPVYLRLTVNGQIEDIALKRSIKATLWNQQKERSNGKSFSDKELNHYIETVDAKIQQIRRQFEMDDRFITARAIKDVYLGRGEEYKSLIEVYEDHNKKCWALVGKDFAQSTCEKFDTSLDHIRKFIRHQYNRDNIMLNEVSGAFIHQFEFYLKSELNLQQNSTVKHLKNLKKVIRIALANDWIKKDPFVGTSFKHEETHPEFLSQEELNSLIEKEFAIPRIDQVRDLFVFCCFTGLAFVDMQNLTKENLVTGVNDKLWIRIARQKIKNMCNIPVLSQAKKIIDKYADHPDCKNTNKLLPQISNQKMNAYLKEIADVCGIQKRLTTHLARHTCATVVMLANNVTIENVAKILGHSNTKMTQHYAKVLDSSIMRDMENVEHAFSKVV